jgi:hypothetical protein
MKDDIAYLNEMARFIRRDVLTMIRQRGNWLARKRHPYRAGSGTGGSGEH